MSLRDLWDATKCTNISTTWGETREKGAENIWRNNAQKYPKFYERHDESTHPRSSKISKINKLQESHTKTFYNQTVKSQNQRESWKQHERSNLLCTRILNKIKNKFLINNYEGPKAVRWRISSAERKISVNEEFYLFLAKLSLKNVGDIKIFLNKQKLREFTASWPALQELLKRVLQSVRGEERRRP